MEQLVAIIEALAQVVNALVEVTNNQAIAIAELNDICNELDRRIDKVENLIPKFTTATKPRGGNSSGNSICTSGKRCTDGRNCIVCRNFQPK